LIEKFYVVVIESAVLIKEIFVWPPPLLTLIEGVVVFWGAEGNVGELGDTSLLPFVQFFS